MKKSRFTEAQIVAILKELDAGMAATSLRGNTDFMPIPSGYGAISTPAGKPAT